MPVVSRILAAVGALLLIGTFFFPLWQFTFDAPQYPEGLSMSIHIDKLTGDLSQLNDLNHYVGMRTIRPETFWELRYFAWVVVALVVWGVAAAVLGRRAVLLSWVAALCVSGVLGLYDFWHWLYSYGHDLDPRAPIEMDPFTPPVLGEKELMNFVITALPKLGALVILVAIGLAMAALVIDLVRRRPREA